MSKAFNLFLTLTIIGFIVIVIVVVIVKGKEIHQDQARKRNNELDMISGVNKIKTASKHWSRNVKLNYMRYLSQERERLELSQRKPVGGGYATQRVITVSIDGNMDYFSVDIDAINELYNYLDLTLDD